MNEMFKNYPDVVSRVGIVAYHIARYEFEARSGRRQQRYRTARKGC